MPDVQTASEFGRSRRSRGPRQSRQSRQSRQPRQPRQPRRRSTRLRVAAVIVGVVLVGVVVIASLAIGTRTIPADRVVAALLGSGRGTDAVVVIDLRLPRTVIGLCAGVGLGLSGAIVQAVTRNPLADPGILGVTAGSAFVVALAVAFLGLSSTVSLVWFALVGALAATVAVYAIGSSGGRHADPVRLTLAGVALGAVLGGVIAAIRLSNPAAFDVLRAWESGSLQNRGWDVLIPVIPFLAVGVILALALGPSLNAVALGEDLARSLGANVVVVRVVSVAAVTLLAGGATAVAGPIAFVGLMIPHVARFIVGPDQRWILVTTLLFAPVLLVASDILGRIVLRPGEIPVGIVTAVVGAPVLIALVRRSRAVTL